MAEAKRDGNNVPTLLGVSSVDSVTPIAVYADPTTHRLLVDLPSGSGDVVGPASATDNAVARFDLTTGKLIQNSAVIIADTTGAITGPHAVTVGVTGSATGTLLMKGLTSGTVTIQTADIAGTYTLTLPIDDGTASQYLQTNGSGVLSWQTVSAAAGGANTQVQYNNAGAIAGITGATSNGTSMTLTSPTLATSPTAAGATWTDLGTVTTADINGGTLDGTVIGGTSAAAITGTTITASTRVNSTSVVVADTVTAPLTTFVIGAGTQLTPPIQVVDDNSSVSMGFARFALAAATTTHLAWARSRGATVGDYTIVADGDLLGQMTWAGSDSIDFAPAAAISVLVDGTPGSNDMPGRIVFSTTADAGSAVTDRWIIDSAGALKPATDGAFDIGTTALAVNNLHLDTGATINFENGNSVITHSAAILTVSTGDLRVTTAGTNTASVVTVGGTQTLTGKTLTSPVLTTPSAFTTGGTITLDENTSIALDPAGSADGKYTGITIAGTAGAALAFGEVAYLSSVNSRWVLADADAASTSDRMLGMVVLAAAADTNPTTLLLMGQIRADVKFPALTIGSAVYVGETPGAIQVAIPVGADNVIRRVGYALTADEIYFNPSMDSQITVA